MAKAKKSESYEIKIEEIETRNLSVWLIGTSPLLMHRYSMKSITELLLPSKGKNKAAKESNLKHDPYFEYRSSVYRDQADGATRIVFPGGALRKAIASAALDIPGSSKAQIGRLARVVEYNLPIYGVPKISCMMVRQSGINRAPDVRTRAIFPEWCTQATIQFAYPNLNQGAVCSLLHGAGNLIGLGEGRNEKGSSLSFGCFRIATGEKDQALLDRIISTGGKSAQDDGLENPQPFDDATREILDWFFDEIKRRNEQHRLRGDDDKEEEVAPAAA